MSGSFFDTNCLLYLGTKDVRKADRIDALAADGGAISVQVLNEIVHVARRKLKLSDDDLDDVLSHARLHFKIVPVTLEVHEFGLYLISRYKFAIYDSFIVAAALLAGCDTLWSEDMQDGLRIEGQLQIRNPFTTPA